jgi:rRNA maturation RNase YbeY
MVKKRVFIEFNYSKPKFKNLIKSTINKEYLSRYIKKLCGKKRVYMSYNFISSEEQIKINTTFKDHNYNTDILTFGLTNTECELTGDVYISLREVKNVRRYNVEISEEINRVLIHGFLHIIGYNDETNSEKKIMRKEENKYIKFIQKNCSTWNKSVYHY